jgi:hypothetical protein
MIIVKKVLRGNHCDLYLVVVPIQRGMARSGNHPSPRHRATQLALANM